MTDRICCLNPNCNRTAAAEKHPGSTYIVCAKCWRSMPRDFKGRWKLLNARSRKLDRMSRKPSFNRPERVPQWNRLADIYDRAWAALTMAIKHYYTAGERPIGIEDFLKENGIV